MFLEDDLLYHRRREAEERAASRRATDPTIADIHFAMAERYADRLWSIEEALSDIDRKRAS